MEKKNDVLRDLDSIAAAKNVNAFLTFLQHPDCIHHLVSSILLRAPVLGGIHTGTQTPLGMYDQG